MNSDSQQETVHCATHGSKGVAIVCMHLFDCLSHRTVSALGFNEFSPTPDDPEPVALCDHCEAVRLSEGIWNDRVDQQASIRVLCVECFSLLRRATHLGDGRVDA
jgi:hypothetical protein